MRKLIYIAGVVGFALFFVCSAIFLFAEKSSAQAEKSPERPKNVRLYCLDAGNLGIDKGWLSAMRDVGTWLEIPIRSFLIVHSKGLVLFDTGMNIKNATDPEGYWGPTVLKYFVPRMTEEQTPQKQLEKLGYSTKDITYVVPSHFHLDHVGNMKYFPNSTIIVQKEELRAAWWPEAFQRTTFVLKDYEDTRDFNFLQLKGEDWDIFGDGKVVVLSTPGHTQGHQSLLVRLEKTGTVVLTGDAVYLVENLKGVPPGVTYNVTQSMESIERIKRFAERDKGQVWPSHDIDFYKGIKHAPEYYE